MLALAADTGRPVKRAGPSAKKPEASKETSKEPSAAMDTSKNELVGYLHSAGALEELVSSAVDDS